MSLPIGWRLLEPHEVVIKGDRYYIIQPRLTYENDTYLWDYPILGKRYGRTVEQNHIDGMRLDVGFARKFEGYVRRVPLHPIHSKPLPIP